MSHHYLDVALGLSATYLALSLLCSASREAIASLFQSRAKMLLDGVLTLLYEPAGLALLAGILPSLRRLLRRNDGFDLSALGAQSLAAAVLRHPLITGQAQAGRMPSYIPSALFARATMDTLQQRYGSHSSARALLAQLNNPPLQRTLLALLGTADDLAALEQALLSWYDTVMARTTGWYKRRSQSVLFGLALGFAVALNIDSFALSQRLWRDPNMAQQSAELAAELSSQLSAQLSAQAGQQGGQASSAAELPAPVLPSAALLAAATRQLDSQRNGLPIGWPAQQLQGWAELGHGAQAGALLLAALGWLMTAFAASLGAPFWFDGVGWLLALRGTGSRPPSSLTGAPGSGSGERAQGQR